MNQVACGGCQTPLQIPPELIGQQIQCPVCQQVISVPPAPDPMVSGLPTYQSPNAATQQPATQQPGMADPTTPMTSGLGTLPPSDPFASQPASMQQPVGGMYTPGVGYETNPGMLGQGGTQPAAPPTYNPVQQTTAAPQSQAPLEIVNQGVRLIFFSIICLIIGVVLTIAEYSMGGVGGTGSLAMFASMVLLVIGLFKCTKVPEQSGAKSSASFAFWCACFCAGISLFSVAFVWISEFLASILLLASVFVPFAAILFFMSFIERVGQFTRQQEYVDEIESIRTAFFLGLFAPILGVLMLIIIPIKLSFFVIIAGIIAMIYFLIKFIVLLSDLKFHRKTAVKPKPGEAWKTNR